MDINMKLEYFGERDLFYQLKKSHLEFVAQQAPLSEGVTRRVICPVFENGEYKGISFDDWNGDQYEGFIAFSKKEIKRIIPSSQLEMFSEDDFNVEPEYVPSDLQQKLL